MPSSAPSSRDDQCVTPSRSGGGSRVASTTPTSSTTAGRPGLGRSNSPPTPSAAYRFLQAITVGFEAPTRSTISVTGTPSAASNTIRARRARPAGIDGARSHDSRISRSRGGTSTVTAMHHDPTNTDRGEVISLTSH
jgi:hypothetical protein